MPWRGKPRPRRGWTKRAVAGSGPIHPQYLTETIARHAAADAVFTADGGSPMVWCLRHIPSTGRNRTVVSLSHGTMANAMPQALGAQAAYPNRQVISLSGDGGLAMLMGDLLTTVQENLPIKVVVFNNGSLGFVEIEQKVEGLLDIYTGPEEPRFRAGRRGDRAVGAPGRGSGRSGLPPCATGLATPGPALLDVVVDRNELVMPAKIEPSKVFGMALYSAKGILAGGERAKGVIDLIKDVIKP
jgi:pyruvate dehydrogenase (quinone)